MKRAVIGIVETNTQVQAVLELLRKAGITQESVSVLMPDRRRTRDFAHEHHTKAPEGAIAGVGAGGAVGGAVGLLAGLGAIAVPGVGPLLAAGPVMAALSGAAVGAGVGGIAGALVGAGVPEIEAKVYAGKLLGGNILLAVHVESAEHERTAREVLRAAGAHDVDSAGEVRIFRHAPAQPPQTSAHTPPHGEEHHAHRGIQH
jgi:hypothetical protein